MNLREKAAQNGHLRRLKKYKHYLLTDVLSSLYGRGRGGLELGKIFFGGQIFFAQNRGTNAYILACYSVLLQHGN